MVLQMNQNKTSISGTFVEFLHVIPRIYRKLLFFFVGGCGKLLSTLKLKGRERTNCVCHPEIWAQTLKTSEYGNLLFSQILSLILYGSSLKRKYTQQAITKKLRNFRMFFCILMEKCDP